jgi:hypothetical protein
VIASSCFLTEVNDMPNENTAQHLAELEVKRNRTLADLETVQAAVRSVQRSMESQPARQDHINNEFIEKLDNDTLPEEGRQAIYREWNESFKASVVRYNKLADERDQLHVQELILVRMLTELDYQIKVAKETLNSRA